MLPGTPSLARRVCGEGRIHQKAEAYPVQAAVTTDVCVMEIWSQSGLLAAPSELQEEST